MYLSHNKLLSKYLLICILHIDLYIYYRRRNNIYGRIIAYHQLTLARAKLRFCYTCSNQRKQYREQLGIISWQRINATGKHTHISTILSITKTILCHKHSNYQYPPPRKYFTLSWFTYSQYIYPFQYKYIDGPFLLDSLRQKSLQFKRCEEIFLQI